MNTYLFRTVTESDLDELFSSKDADWLRENFESRDTIISDYRGGYLELMASEDNKERLFFSPKISTKTRKENGTFTSKKIKGYSSFKTEVVFTLFFIQKVF